MGLDGVQRALRATVCGGPRRNSDTSENLSLETRGKRLAILHMSVNV